MEPDFSGYATKAGLKCSDGRTITPEAFKKMDGARVPLVWQHGHSDPMNILGHALLEARNDGIYAYGFFNDTKQGQNARALVEHKDIRSMSIYANQLVEKSLQVLHGVIREVSLVLSGANPGAFIDYVRVAHSDDPMDVTIMDDEAIIHTGLTIELKKPEKKTEEPKDNKIENELEHKTVQEVYDTLTDEQKDVVNYMIGAALEVGEDDDATHSNDDKDEVVLKEGSNDMTHNVFEQNGGTVVEKHTLSHADVKGIVSDAIKLGSLRDAVESYALKHGIDNIDVLFPDARSLTDTPDFHKRRTEWVAGVLNGTRHTPFSRVKTIVADLTQEEARARGYIKGHYKIEEWFGVSKRTTGPTTIYKKQKLDRDDILDITDFDVVAWLKQEMRIMLEEELARAILMGDGRDVSSEDKIKDPIGAADGNGIRSILNDHELFVTTVNVNVDDANSSYEEVVDAIMDGMEYFKGTGTPTFYTTIRTLNQFLKAKDGMGRRLYQNKNEVAQALGVSAIVTVEPMNDMADLIGIIVNLQDYNIGADRGGEVSMFDDFDIDYNQQKYLIETRLSGALTKIKSALVIKRTGPTDQMLAEPTVPTFVASTGVVTIPTMTNVTYKNADTGATLSSGAQSALAEGATLNVQATANAGYYFANDANTLWPFFRRPS